jgi:hypothetical protein
MEVAAEADAIPRNSRPEFTPLSSLFAFGGADK